MDRPYYDTKEGIEAQLDSYDNFYKLVKERKAACFDRRERLQFFCIFGRFNLPESGDLLKIYWRAYENKIYSNLPKVMTKEEFISETAKRGLKESIEGFCGGGTQVDFLPRPHEVCPSCGKGWTIENCYDFNFDFQQGDGGFYHGSCYKALRIRKHREHMAETAVGLTEMLQEAGFTHVKVEPSFTPKHLRDVDEERRVCEEYGLENEEENNALCCGGHFNGWLKATTAEGDFNIGFIAESIMGIELMGTGITMKEMWEKLKEIPEAFNESMGGQEEKEFVEKMTFIGISDMITLEVFLKLLKDKKAK